MHAAWLKPGAEGRCRVEWRAPVGASGVDVGTAAREQLDRARVDSGGCAVDGAEPLACRGVGGKRERRLGFVRR